MAAETAPSAAGTSTPEAPETGQGFDYERSYNELRPQFTRTTQELAAERERLSEYEQLFDALHDSDPAVQRQAFEALGLEAAEEVPQGGPAADNFVDPLEEEIERLRGTVGELQTRAQEQEAERVQTELDNARDDFIGEALDFIEKETKAKFSEKEEEVLGNLAIAMEDDKGMPDVQGAYNILYGEDGVLEINRQRWIDTKSGAAQAPLGRTIPTDQKPKNAKERIAYIDERMRALQDQQ